MTRRSTFAEKILNAPAGSIVYIEPDIVLSHDNSARVRKLFQKMGGENVLHPDRLVVVLDRKMTGTVNNMIQDYNSIHDFMEEQCVEHFFDCDKGICHQVLAGFLHQGLVVVGSDSHTCTAGALDCFAVGLNKTETAYLWKTGKMWFRVPETVKITLSGKFREGVYAKDFALHILGMLRDEDVDYTLVEYHGEGVKELSISDRMTIANISAEAGLKTSVFPPDDRLADYFGDYAVQGVWADENAVYHKEFTLDLGQVMPLVMVTHQLNDVKSVAEAETLEIQQGLIGACSNGRIEDLWVVARILEGKRLASGFQLSVIPASYDIYIQAREEGLVDKITKAGASVLGASCGPCLGSSHMLNADTKRFITTTNSNSMQRMSEVGVEKYIASPATVAATALTGKLSAEVEYSGEVYGYWATPVVAVRIDECDDRRRGYVWNYTDVNHISSGQLFEEKQSYRISIEDSRAMVPHLLAGLDASFATRVESGDIILAGEDFGCGKLIKHAAIGLVEAGVKAVIVKSVNRNFFRMALNHGLLIIVAPEIIEAYRSGDAVIVDISDGKVNVNEKEYCLPEYNPIILEMIAKKGIMGL